MTTIRCPRGILVATGTRQLLHALVAKGNRVQLKISILSERLKHYQSAIRRPIRIRSIVLIAEVKRGQQIRVRSVSVANIYLRMPRATARECDPATVGTKRGTRIVRATP